MMIGTDSCLVCVHSDTMKHCGPCYFRDCQTQLEGNQDQVFDASFVEEKDAENEVEQITSQVLGGRTRKPKSADKKGKDFTIWEMFNFVLRGQVEELVALGAPPSIKMTVLQLWSHYLKKLGVAFISKEETVLPSTDVGVLKRDAKLVFGVNDEIMKLKKKNDTPIKEINVSLSESQDLSSKKVKKKTRIQMKKAVMAKLIEYIGDNEDDHSCYLNESTIGNDTVTADKDMNSTQNVVEGDISLLASAQLYKENEDKISRNNIFINNFRLSINHLTRQKLIMLLYLALLYERSGICLSDIIRWIREGHLSYFEVGHLLPENYFLEGKSRTQFRIVYELPSYESLRLGSYCLAEYLGIDLPLPVWSTIAKKYVMELHLPFIFCDFIQYLINLAPKVFNNKYFIELPCYEGRILAIIMIIMKIMFGLDGKTEHKISKVASKLNVWLIPKRRAHRKKLFVWCKWVKQLICRNAILAEHHFPSKQVICPETFGNSNSFINMLKKREKDSIETSHIYQHQNCFLSDTYPALINLFNNVLEQLDNTKVMEKEVDFPACTTPYSLYTVQILEKSMEVNNLLTTKARKVLTEDFCDSDVSYLFHPSLMRKLVEKKGHYFKPDVRSAQKRFYVHKSSQNKRCCEGSFKRPCFIAVTECHRQCINTRNSRKNKPRDRLFVESTEENKRESLRIKQITLSKALSFALGKRGKKSGCKRNLKKRKQENEHMKHKTLKLYLPRQQYWVLHDERCTNEKEFESQIFVKLPFAFAWFLSECALLSEMKKFDLYNELVFMEKYYKDHVCS